MRRTLLAVATCLAAAAAAATGPSASTWALDAVMAEFDDPRAASTTSPADLRAFRLAKGDTGTCRKPDAEMAAALGKLRAMAERGIVEAQTFLGMFGMVCPLAVPDREEPSRWADKAAAAGYLPGLEVQGMIYEFPKTPNRSEEKSFRAYKAAAEKGSAGAMLNTRQAYCLGKGTPPDPKAGAQWGERLKAWYRANGRSEDAAKMKSGC